MAEILLKWHKTLFSQSINEQLGYLFYICFVSLLQHWPQDPLPRYDRHLAHHTSKWCRGMMQLQCSLYSNAMLTYIRWSAFMCVYIMVQLQINLTKSCVPIIYRWGMKTIFLETYCMILRILYLGRWYISLICQWKVEGSIPHCSKALSKQFKVIVAGPN